LKTTPYFDLTRSRPDRAFIADRWIMQVMQHPERISVQSNGRIRKWGKIAEMGDRYLRVVVLPDGETVHNAFFDRSYRP